jgi:chromate transporter
LTTAAPDRPAPAPGVRAIFVGFLQIGLSGFGGVLPHARHALVDTRRWLGEREFAELLSLGQALPGPNIVNMGLMMGYRFHGVTGALAAVTGLMFAPMVIVLLLAAAYGKIADNLLAQRVMSGIAFAGAGLILATGVRMVLVQPRRFAVWALAGGTVAAKIGFGLPLLTVLALFTVIGLACTWKGWIR